MYFDMPSRLTTLQSEELDSFTAGLEGRTRMLVTKYVKVPNSPSGLPEMTGLHNQYGQDLERVSDQVENLRKELGLTYKELQPELQNRLYD